MKNILLIVVLVLIFNAIFVFSGGLSFLAQTEKQAQPEAGMSADVVDVFRFTLEDEVRKKVGVPVNGYEPHMFIQVFPGLVATDFAGVEASSGIYKMINGTLQFVPDDTQLAHDAAGAITRTGIATVLKNVTTRIGVDLTHGGTITDVMRSLVSGG